MLFNSFIFIFGFLPVALGLTYALGRWKVVAAKLTLTILSLGFYAWWKPVHLPLLMSSILFNFVMGGIIQKQVREGNRRAVRLLLTLGLVANVSLLGYFKYANFIVDNANALTGANFSLAHVALPLAISFFTFQKIAYLVDSARGEAKQMKLLDFALFASFFPQLIAGPITHYGEIVPQFKSRLFGTLIWRNILIGLVIFSIGLSKKTIIADTLSDYANPLYQHINQGGQADLLTGWLACLTFTVQIYFDFSGYSDMAIGLARMFGVKLPLNFHSPLRAANIIDYWRRWHMTLQRFIVLYIYRPIALPLNRFAANRRLEGWSAFALQIGLPTFITFVISGIWHGAGWTFVVWGVMHALYLATNEVWRERGKRRRRAARRAKQVLPEPGFAVIAGYHILTLLAVFFANVMFRATTVPDAVEIWRGMVGLHGLGSVIYNPHFDWGVVVALVVGFLIIFLLPNTQQIMRRFDPALNWNEWRDVGRPVISWTWTPTTLGLIIVGINLFLGIMFIQRGQAIFLYFNF